MNLPDQLLTKMSAAEIEWRPIAGYESFYDVSRCGKVRRSPFAPVKAGSIPGHIMCLGKADYFHVILHVNGVKKLFKVHRLVAAAFIAEPQDDRRFVNHIDGDKYNNHADNLEWVTASQNTKHAYRLGLCPSGENHPAKRPGARVGERNGRHILTPSDVVIIREERRNGVVSLRQLAERFGVSISTIHAVEKRKNWALV